MPGKFEVYSDKKGEFRWRLKATNGITIASSGEGYKAKRDCLKGIASVQKNSPGAKILDLEEDEETKTPAKKTPAKKTPAKKTPAKKTTAKKKTGTKKKAAKK
ncbi:MAG: YegP family protein [Planctomycetota bacterium]